MSAVLVRERVAVDRAATCPVNTLQTPNALSISPVHMRLVSLDSLTDTVCVQLSGGGQNYRDGD